MNLEDLALWFPSDTIEIICAGYKDGKDQYVEIGAKEAEDIEAFLIVKKENGNKYTIKFATKTMAMRWDKIINSDYLAKVVSVKEDLLTIYVVYNINFNNTETGDNLYLCMTDEVLGKNKVYEIKKTLEEDYCLKTGDNSYIVVGKNTYNSDDTFIILRDRHYYSVAIKKRREIEPNCEINASDEVYAITKAESKLKNFNNYMIEVWPKGILIDDITTVTQVRTSEKAFLKQGLEYYIKAWGKYAEVEKQIVDEEANKAGFLSYSKAEPIEENKYKLTITNKQNIANFVEQLQKISDDGSLRLYNDNSHDYGIRCVYVRCTDNKEIIIKQLNLAKAIGYSGKVKIDIKASEKQYERREQALIRIGNNDAAMPGFVQKLHGKLPKQAILRDKRKKVRSEAVEAYLKKSEIDFTPNQIAAINIAINTPDFAIIQGPPGTGKTTVINAILNALSDQEPSKESIYGNNLVTAYQRDATKHMAEKLRIYGLPTPTYVGGKDHEADVFDAAIKNWIDNKADKMQKDNIISDAYFKLMNLKLLLQYWKDKISKITKDNVQKNSSYTYFSFALENIIIKIDDLTISVEKMIKDQYIYDSDLQENLKQNKKRYFDKICQKLYKMKDAGQKFLMKYKTLKRLESAPSELIAAIRNLPASIVALKDTNLKYISDLLMQVQTDESIATRREGELTAAEIAMQLENFYDGTVENFDCNQVNILKCHLIVALKATADFPIPKIQFLGEAVALLKSLVDDIESIINVYEVTDEQLILAKYIDAFTNDKLAVQEDIRKYCSVIAATHQKTNDRGDDLHLGRNKKTNNYNDSNNDDSIVAGYESCRNVLIDEAARSTPCDLLIPMVCAEERIIMVGDHRQLPQFINDQVYERITSKEVTDKEKILKETMFEYLINSVQKLQEQDGIPRFITLNTQYRMPKILADIVSTFYKETKLITPPSKKGSEPVYIDCLRKEVNIAWINVPRSLGKSRNQERMNATYSFTRESEALVIVQLIKNILSNKQSATCSIGIITFYSGQRDLILKKLKNERIINDNNKINQKDFPLNIMAKEHEIKIGTVDAFQGMEFDIVVLSMVRSNSKYAFGKHVYGFLRSENRMCVALSRAKRCMLVVGDKEMLTTKEANEQIPALVKFYEKCIGGESNAEIFETR